MGSREFSIDGILGFFRKKRRREEALK